MTMGYLVSPPSEAAWFLAPEVLASRMGESWPEAVVEVVTNPSRPYVLDFELRTGGAWVTGSFGREGQVMVLEGDVVACAEVAAWYRRQVPADQQLVFYDEGYAQCVWLEGQPDPLEIAAPFLSP